MSGAGKSGQTRANIRLFESERGVNSFSIKQALGLALNLADMRLQSALFLLALSTYHVDSQQATREHDGIGTIGCYGTV